MLGLYAAKTEFISDSSEFGSGHENTGTAFFNDRTDPQRWIVHVDRHVCGARAHDSVNRNHKLRRPGHDYRDALVGALNALGPQHLRNVIHGVDELRIGQSYVL